MSYDEKTSYPIGGKQVQGGLPTAALNMLQFNAVTNQWEFIAAVVPPVAALGDLEFLRDLELAGNLVKLHGIRTTVGLLVSVTPATGITFFFVAANLTEAGGGVNLRARAEVRNNTVVRQTLIVGWLPAAASGLVTINKTILQPDSLVGNGALVYDVNLQAITSAINVECAFTGWLQTT